MKKLAWVVSSVIVVLMVAALGWGLLHPANGGSQLVGNKAPEFQLNPLSGGTPPLSLSAYRGQVVVLNFWASWCASCKQEEEVLRSAANRLKGKVQFLGVDIQDSLSAARATQEQAQLPYPLGTVSPAVVTAYRVNGPPQSFFIDRQGVVVAREAGPLDNQALSRYLQLAGVDG